MSIIRSHKKQHPYVQIDKTPLEDRRLSFKARGILAYLLSKPDNWSINIHHLMSESDRDKRDSIQSGLKELENCGYLIRRQIQDKRGRFDWETLIFETPEDLQAWLGSQSEGATSGSTTSGSTTSGKPVNGKPVNGKPVNGKPTYGKSVNGKSGDIVINELVIPDLLINEQIKGNPPSPVPQPSPTQETFCVGGEIHLSDELNQPTTGREEKPKDLTPQPPAPPPSATTNAPSDITRFESVLGQRQPHAPWLQRDDRGKLDWHPDFLEYYRRHLSASPHYARTLCKQAEPSDARLSLTNQKRSEEGREAIAIHGQRWLDEIAKEEAKRQAAQATPFRYPEGPPLEIKKIKLQQRTHRRTPTYAVS